MCLYKKGSNYITYIFISFCPVYCFFLLSIYIIVFSSDCAKDSANRHSMLHTPSPAVNTTDSSTSLVCSSFVFEDPCPFLLPWFQSPLTNSATNSSFCLRAAYKDQKKDAFLNTAKPGVEPPK